MEEIRNRSARLLSLQCASQLDAPHSEHIALHAGWRLFCIFVIFKLIYLNLILKSPATLTTFIITSKTFDPLNNKCVKIRDWCRQSKRSGTGSEWWVPSVDRWRRRPDWRCTCRRRNHGRWSQKCTAPIRSDTGGWWSGCQFPDDRRSLRKVTGTCPDSSPYHGPLWTRSRSV